MELENKIMEIKQIINEKSKYERKLNDALNELDSLTKQERELKAILIKEESDVLRLEKVTLSSIWFSILGSKSEKLNKEKNEYSKAEYDYKIISNTISDLKNEIDNIKHKLINIKLKEEELNICLTQKEELIIEQSLELSIVLKDINKQISHLISQETEINEAIGAGNELVNALNDILTSLNKAKNWGTFDILGGGLVADMVKHSKLEEAKNKMERLKYISNKFIRELKDVNLTLNMNIDISSTLKFADFFFDGLFMDLTVQSRINDSIRNVVNQLNHVNTILNKLNNKLKDNKLNTMKLNEKKKMMLI